MAVIKVSKWAKVVLMMKLLNVTNKFKPTKSKTTVVNLSRHLNLIFRIIDTKCRDRMTCNLLSPKLTATLENQSSKRAMKVEHIKIHFKSLSWKARLKI